MKTRLLPSILNANWAEFGHACQTVVNAGAEGIHLDVMDNHYVPNLTFGPTLCRDLISHGVEGYMDVHLMVQPVDELIQGFLDAGAHRICFHPEASQHVDRSLAMIKSAGIEAGLALNPATPINVLEHVIDHIDYVLIMSVNPGFGGQQFIQSALTKVTHLRQWLDVNKPSVSIGIDGGIDASNIKTVQDAGANEFIVGSAIFKSGDVPATTRQIRDLLD